MKHIGNQLKDMCNQYFQKISSNNVDMFEDMFADDIVLQDWEIDVKGRDAVLNTMHNMFASIMCIQITPIEMYEDGQTVIAVLDIVINNNDILQVVDLICFDEKGKILSIRAYKR